MSFISSVYKSFSPRKVPSVLDHITDVGSSQFEGLDSTYRIRQQYQNVNVQNPSVIPAGHSPLHVAFTGTTCLAPKAQENANWLLKKLFNISQKKRLPIALNSAPRNSNIFYEDGKEDSIFWVQTADEYADYLVYGLQVVEWVNVFHKVVAVKRVVSVQEIISDTSGGSQFRSAEHLPLVHVLAAMNELEAHGVIEDFPIKDLGDRYPYPHNAIIAPCDEYKNGRLVIDKKTMAEIIEKGECSIPALADRPFVSRSSLTKVTPGELSVWPSSNHFPNRDLAVLNIGTRWAEGTTSVTDDGVKRLAKELSDRAGNVVEIEL